MQVLTVNSGNGLTMTLDNGERVLVKIVRVSGSKVRLGIDAPPDVQINRDDVQLRIDNVVGLLNWSPTAGYAAAFPPSPEHHFQQCLGESVAPRVTTARCSMDGPQDAAATDGHVFQVRREGER